MEDHAKKLASARKHLDTDPKHGLPKSVCLQGFLQGWASNRQSVMIRLDDATQGLREVKVFVCLAHNYATHLRLMNAGRAAMVLRPRRRKRWPLPRPRRSRLRRLCS
jgi:hypothetical protein